MSDFSYYFGHPRSEVHMARYGSSVVPPRQYLRGGGRVVGAGNSSVLLILGALALVFLASRRK